MKIPLKLGVESNVVFDGARQEYRYLLERTWDRKPPRVCWAMLNPSTADTETDDPTVAKCQTYARLWGYGGIAVVNLFAIRSTCPFAMKKHASPVGRLNDYHIERAARLSELVVCGWGNHGDHLGRGGAVLRRLHEVGVVPHALRVTQSGQPQHPLYLPMASRPFAMERLAA